MHQPNTSSFTGLCSRPLELLNTARGPVLALNPAHHSAHEIAEHRGRRNWSQEIRPVKRASQEEQSQGLGQREVEPESLLQPIRETNRNLPLELERKEYNASVGATTPAIPTSSHVPSFESLRTDISMRANASGTNNVYATFLDTATTSSGTPSHPADAAPTPSSPSSEASSSFSLLYPATEAEFGVEPTFASTTEPGVLASSGPLAANIGASTVTARNTFSSKPQSPSLSQSQATSNQPENIASTSTLAVLPLPLPATSISHHNNQTHYAQPPCVSPWHTPTSRTVTRSTPHTLLIPRPSAIPSLRTLRFRFLIQNYHTRMQSGNALWASLKSPEQMWDGLGAIVREIVYLEAEHEKLLQTALHISLSRSTSGGGYANYGWAELQDVNIRARLENMGRHTQLLSELKPEELPLWKLVRLFVEEEVKMREREGRLSVGEDVNSASQTSHMRNENGNETEAGRTGSMSGVAIAEQLLPTRTSRNEPEYVTTQETPGMTPARILQEGEPQTVVPIHEMEMEEDSQPQRAPEAHSLSRPNSEPEPELQLHVQGGGNGLVEQGAAVAADGGSNTSHLVTMQEADPGIFSDSGAMNRKRSRDTMEGRDLDEVGESESELVQQPRRMVKRRKRAIRMVEDVSSREGSMSSGANQQEQQLEQRREETVSTGLSGKNRGAEIPSELERRNEDQKGGPRGTKRMTFDRDDAGSTGEPNKDAADIDLSTTETPTLDTTCETRSKSHSHMGHSPDATSAWTSTVQTPAVDMFDDLERCWSESMAFGEDYQISKVDFDLDGSVAKFASLFDELVTSLSPDGTTGALKPTASAYSLRSQLARIISDIQEHEAALAFSLTKVDVQMEAVWKTRLELAEVGLRMVKTGR